MKREHSFSNSYGQCTLCGNHGRHINMDYENDIYPVTNGVIHLNQSLTFRDYVMYAATCRLCNVIYMKKLNLRDNNLGDDGASHISTCLSKFEELNIGRCNIRASGIKSISDAISNLPEPIKKINISNNILGDDGASHISTCLSKIEELHIGRCKISASGIKSISDAISKLPEPMKKLVLSGNNLRDDGASHISTCLSKIEELDIGECKISVSGIKSISDAISKLPEPVTNHLRDHYQAQARHQAECLRRLVEVGKLMNIDKKDSTHLMTKMNGTIIPLSRVLSCA
ncbi:unnamed protein product [Clavelina lepadiformis]|uniref:RNI-like protein n=1 Tax=Clavelina lepadiformis TaxID=159417 RepID=A0ABP0GEN1_CLALP